MINVLCLTLLLPVAATTNFNFVAVMHMQVNASQTLPASLGHSRILRDLAERQSGCEPAGYLPCLDNEVFCCPVGGTCCISNDSGEPIGCCTQGSSCVVNGESFTCSSSGGGNTSQSQVSQAKIDRAIAGGVVAGVLFLLSIGILLYRRWVRKRAETDSEQKAKLYAAGNYAHGSNIQLQPTATATLGTGAPPVMGQQMYNDSGVGVGGGRGF